MNKITIIENAAHGKKSAANWSYRVHLIHDHDAKEVTAVRDSFGGLTRALRTLTMTTVEVERVMSPTCSKMGVRSIEKLQDVEEYAETL